MSRSVLILIAAALGVAAASAPAIAQTCNGRAVTKQGTVVPQPAAQFVSGSVTATTGRYYDVVVAQAGTYTFTFGPPGSATYDTWLCLFDPAWTMIAENDDTVGVQAQIVQAISIPGAYKIGVSGFGSFAGSYTLAYQSNIQNPPPGPAPLVLYATPDDGALTGAASVALSGWVVRSSGAANVHAEFSIDGGPFSDGTLVSQSGLSSFTTPPLAEGTHTYKARAHDNAGLFSAATLPAGFTIDLSPPAAGLVNDGPGADLDLQGSASAFAANWGGFSDAVSGIIRYEWGVGTVFGGVNVMGFTDVGLATRASSPPQFSLIRGLRYYVTVRATDGVGNQATATSDGVSAMSFDTAVSAPAGVVGGTYLHLLTALFGSPPHAFTLAGGAPPPGIALIADGHLSGVPAAPGRFLFAVRVTDISGTFKIEDHTLLVYPASAGFFQTTGNEGFGVPVDWAIPSYAYSWTPAAQGGVTPVVWNLDDGDLPAGLTLDGFTGEIRGLPSGPPGSYLVRVRGSDAAHPTGVLSADYEIVVTGIMFPLAVTSVSPLPGALVGSPYEFLLAASGGVRPYSWSLNGGALPQGILLYADGAIRGVPVLPGTSAFTIHASDDTGNTASLAATLDVTSGGGALGIVPGELPLMVMGSPLAISLLATGGQAPYAWSVTSGSLPPGLSLLPSGSFSGAPSARGLYRFTVGVRDSSTPPRGASSFYRVSVLGASGSGSNYAIVTPDPLPDADIGAPYAAALAALGGAAPHAWSISSGSLPPGVTLDGSTGALSGLPSVGGSFSFVAVASSAGGLTAVRTFDLRVRFIPESPIGRSGYCGSVGIDLLAPLALLWLACRRAGRRP